MKNLFFLCSIILHNTCSGQLLNSSFENWTFRPDPDINAQSWTLDHWQHCDKNWDLTKSLYGTYRDSVPQTGMFALTLSRWYNYVYDVAKFKNACTLKPDSLTGYYKYPLSILSSGKPDTAQVLVYLTKFNPNMHLTETIGTGVLDLTATNVYTLFQVPIAYRVPNVFPDSITIVLQPSKFKSGMGFCPTSGWCSFLTVDNFNLSFTTGTTAVPDQPVYRIYPNPASEGLTVSGDILNESLTIFNTLGELVYAGRASQNPTLLDIRHLKSGLYFLRIKGKTSTLLVN